MATSIETRWLIASKAEPKRYLVRESQRERVAWSYNIERGEKFTNEQRARDRTARRRRG